MRGALFGVLMATFLFLFSACAHVGEKGSAENPDRPEPWGQHVVKPAPEPVVPPEPGAEEAPEATLADPIEPWNRAMYVFNDNLYMHVLKPATKAYNAVLPEGVRVTVRNFFNNVDTPVRLANSILEGNVKGAGVEVARFTVNSTLGLAGFVDVARDNFKIEPQEKDLGVTLGKWGLGEGFYIVWPFLGPSTLRDTVGTAGDDLFLAPVSYVTPTIDSFGITSYRYFNNASLQLGDYEELRNSSLEPYSALKNAYFQYRRGLVNKDP